jgi:cysteine desulfurase
MGLSNDQARASLRFSIGRFTTGEDIQKAAQIIPAAIAKLRELSPMCSPVLAA